MSAYLIRKIESGELAVWWKLRLKALHDHPDAFGSDYATSLAHGPTYIERGFFDGGPNALFGAFDDRGELVAQSATVVDAGKRSHIGYVISVYTHPDHRRAGVAARLVTAAIDHLRQFPETSSIRISVNASNKSAIHVYESMGFTRWGEEPDAIRTADGTCHNELHMVLTS